MEIVIDIPEKYLNSNIIDVTLFAGANKTITDVNVENEYTKFQILPKGHGDLIDRDVAYEEFDKAHLSKKEMIGKLIVFGVPTVIPADNEVG